MNKTFALFRRGDYSDGGDSLVVTSKDKSKLEAYREQLQSRQALKSLLYGDYIIELNKLKVLSPFTEPEPTPLPKWDPGRKQTKEEQRERTEAKYQYQKEVDRWRDKQREHTEKLAFAANEMVLEKYEIKGSSINFRDYYYGYYSHFDDGDFYISEVNEL